MISVDSTVTRWDRRAWRNFIRYSKVSREERTTLQVKSRLTPHAWRDYLDQHRCHSSPPLLLRQHPLLLATAKGSHHSPQFCEAVLDGWTSQGKTSRKKSACGRYLRTSWSSIKRRRTSSWETWRESGRRISEKSSKSTERTKLRWIYLKSKSKRNRNQSTRSSDTMRRCSNSKLSLIRAHPINLKRKMPSPPHKQKKRMKSKTFISSSPGMPSQMTPGDQIQESSPPSLFSQE